MPRRRRSLGSPDPRSRYFEDDPMGEPLGLFAKSGCDPAALGFSPSHPPVHEFLGVPIASPTRVYGYIGLIDKVGLEEFSEEDERLAVILAAQVGRVYQNGSLYADVLAHASNLEREIAARGQTEKALAERVRYGSLVAEVGAILTRNDPPEVMLQLCSEALVRHLDAALARIWTMNPADGTLVLQASAGLDIQTDGPDRLLAFANIDLIARERKPHFTNDVLSDPMVHDKERAKRERITAFAGYPLIVEDRLGGVVVVFSREPFNPEILDAIGSTAQRSPCVSNTSTQNELFASARNTSGYSSIRQRRQSTGSTCRECARSPTPLARASSDTRMPAILLAATCMN